jgi:transposase
MSYDMLIDLPEQAADALLADKAYHTDAIREDLKERGIKPVISPKSNRAKAIRYSKRLYRQRNCIERVFGQTASMMWRNLGAVTSIAISTLGRTIAGSGQQQPVGDFNDRGRIDPDRRGQASRSTCGAACRRSARRCGRRLSWSYGAKPSGRTTIESMRGIRSKDHIPG